MDVEELLTLGLSLYRSSDAGRIDDGASEGPQPVFRGALDAFAGQGLELPPPPSLTSVVEGRNGAPPRRRGHQAPALPHGADEQCPLCGALSLSLDARESRLLCLTEGCGFSRHEMVLMQSFADRDRTFYVSRYSYKRSTHFRELLTAIQGKTKSEVPDTVVQTIRSELKKNRITDREAITPTLVRAFLKKNELAIYYDASAAIAATVSGIPPLCLTSEQEAALLDCFAATQQAWEMLCAEKEVGARKSLTSYHFVLFKLSQLLQLDELGARCTMLKSRDKIHSCDVIWAKICAKLGWQYIPTV